MPHRRATTRADTSHAQGKARTNKRTRAAPGKQHHAPKTRKPRNCTNQAQSRGIPTPHTQPTPPRPATTPHQGSMFPSRTQCANHGPATGEREPPEHTPPGARPPRRRGESPRRSRDKEKIRVPQTPLGSAKGGENATNTTMQDSSGQQRTRTSPTIT